MSDSSFVVNPDMSSDVSSESSGGYESMPDDRPTLNPSILLDILSRLPSPNYGFDNNESKDDMSGIEFDDGSDADDERSPSDSCPSPSSINGSPRLPYEGNTIFEGNIWNEIAEADDGINEVNDGFCAILEKERIHLEEEHRRRDWLVGNGTYQVKETKNLSNAGRFQGENDDRLATPSDMEGIIGTLVEEPPSCGPQGEDSQVDDPGFGSPMSLDFPGPKAPAASIDCLDTPASPFYDPKDPSTPQSKIDLGPAQSLVAKAKLPVRGLLHARTHPELVLRYSSPSSRHHPYKRTRNGCVGQEDY